MYLGHSEKCSHQFLPFTMPLRCEWTGGNTEKFTATLRGDGLHTEEKRRDREQKGGKTKGKIKQQKEKREDERKCKTQTHTQLEMTNSIVLNRAEV